MTEADQSDNPNYRRHYGGADPARNGTNWLFADGHVKWHSANNAMKKLVCCVEYSPAYRGDANIGDALQVQQG